MRFPSPPDQQTAKPSWWAWYDGKRWRALKAATHLANGYTCGMCGCLCVGRSPAPNSPVCDHKVPHRGDATLFFDPDNLWTVCKQCHDSEKQRIEKTGYSSMPDASGWPSDPRHPANRRP